MKVLQILFLTILLVSCAQNKKENEAEGIVSENNAKSPIELGQELFEGMGKCTACHKPEQKIVGPSIVQIAKIYKDKNGDMVAFLKGEGKPLVDPSQYDVMKTNFAITKTMSDNQLKALEAYMYSFLNPK